MNIFLSAEISVYMVFNSIVLDLTEIHSYLPRGRVSKFCQEQTDWSVYHPTIYGRAFLLQNATYGITVHMIIAIYGNLLLYQVCDIKIQACFDNGD